jgi:hypothetical protein
MYYNLVIIIFSWFWSIIEDERCKVDISEKRYEEFQNMDKVYKTTGHET